MFFGKNLLFIYFCDGLLTSSLDGVFSAFMVLLYLDEDDEEAVVKSSLDTSRDILPIGVYFVSSLLKDVRPEYFGIVLAEAPIDSVLSLLPDRVYDLGYNLLRL